MRDELDGHGSSGNRRLLLGCWVLVFSGCISFAGLTGGNGSEAGGAADSGADQMGDARREAAPSADGTLPTGDAQPAADCGTFSLPPASSLQDSFDASTLSPNWVSAAKGCASQVSGELVSDPVANPDVEGGCSVYCLFYSAQTYHLTCNSITLEVPEAMHPLNGAQTVIYLVPKGSPQINALIVEGGSFSLEGQGVGTYDPHTDVWWRLRETSGTLYFDTSTDGETWKTRGNVPETTPLDDIRIGIGAGVHPIGSAGECVADAGEAKFRCFNLSSAVCQ